MIYDMTHEEKLILKNLSALEVSKLHVILETAFIKSQKLLYLRNSHNLLCQPDSGTNGTRDLISTHKARLCEGRCVVV